MPIITNEITKSSREIIPYDKKQTVYFVLLSACCNFVA